MYSNIKWYSKLNGIIALNGIVIYVTLVVYADPSRAYSPPLTFYKNPTLSPTTCKQYEQMKNYEKYENIKNASFWKHIEKSILGIANILLSDFEHVVDFFLC